MPDNHLSLSAPCCGGDRQFLPVARLGELLGRVAVPPLGSEMVGLAAACGRVLAEDIVAAGDLPAGDSSAMDGYALAFADLGQDYPTTLPVVGRVSSPPGTRSSARCGAAKPSGFSPARRCRRVATPW